jgi:hypothetical protein
VVECAVLARTRYILHRFFFVPGLRYIYIYISSLGSYLLVKYVSSGMMNEWKSKFGAVGGWTSD